MIGKPEIIEYKRNFTKGVSKDGLSFSTASYSPRDLEVSFLNGTVKTYYAYDVYNTGYPQTSEPYLGGP